MPRIKRYLVSTHYDTLRIKQTATDKEIKDAFIESCKKCHPDVNNSPEAAEQFRKIQDSYRILSNSSTKISYDYEIGNLGKDYAADGFEDRFHIRPTKRKAKPMDSAAERAVMQR